jgi:hypothetical protein
MLWLSRFTRMVMRPRFALALPLIAALACGDSTTTAPKRAAPQRASTTIDPLVSISVTPSNLTFGPIQAGTYSAWQQVTITNTGSVNAVWTGFNSDGPFNLTTDCTTGSNYPALAPGVSCHAWLQFGAGLGSAGTFTGTLIISVNDAASPHVVTLTGIALGTPAISVTPGSMGFGSVALGTATSGRPLKITNTGSAPLVIGSLTLGGTNPDDFGIWGADNCTGVPAVSLSPGQSCTAYVSFEPTRIGARSATVTIAHNAPGGSVVVPLSGTGVKGSGGYIP